MLKTVSLAAATMILVGLFGCGSSTLPDNATTWLKQYEQLGTEAIESTKSAKSLDLTDASAVEAHNTKGVEFMDRLNKHMDEGKKLSESLNKVQQQLFVTEMNKITERVESEKEKYGSGQ